MSRQKQSSKRKRLSSAGFTMIEVMVSIGILTVGLLGVAMLLGTTIASGTRARYMNMANVLASEKLDNLTKWPSSGTACAQSDPNICAGGSLTGPATCASTDIYCDQITVNEASGTNYETQTQKVPDPANPGNFKDQTTTIVHTNTGCIDTPANCGVPNPAAGGSTFTRRWLITTDPTIKSAGATATVTGLRRITVVVTLNSKAGPPVSFQMSMVRP